MIFREPGKGKGEGPRADQLSALCCRIRRKRRGRGLHRLQRGSRGQSRIWALGIFQVPFLRALHRNGMQTGSLLGRERPMEKPEILRRAIERKKGETAERRVDARGCGGAVLTSEGRRYRKGVAHRRRTRGGRKTLTEHSDQKTSGAGRLQGKKRYSLPSVLQEGKKSKSE